MAAAMDSKSISRKGVGVQVPALAPAAALASAAGAAAPLGWRARLRDCGRFLRASAARWRTRARAPLARGDADEVSAVERVLAELRPALVADGGGIDLIAVDDGWVHVRLRGACTHCPAQASTLRGALEPRLRERLPFVRGLRAD